MFYWGNNTFLTYPLLGGYWGDEIREGLLNWNMHCGFTYSHYNVGSVTGEIILYLYMHYLVGPGII